MTGGPAFASELVRKRIDYSFARPSPTLRLKPGRALAALASGSGAAVIATGRGMRLELRFAPGPGLARPAALMARHCEGGSP